MSQQLLSVSRAARLVGASRAALQRQIRNNELPTFEGKITVTDLLRLYPDTHMEDNRMLERVEEIKARATPGNREREAMLPAPEVLAERLTGLSYELVETKNLLRHYSTCAEELVKKLSALAHSSETHLRQGVEEILTWTEQEMQRRPERDAASRLLAKDTFLRIIAAHAKIIPSGHEFFVEGSDTLLDASIRAGLRFNYGCGNGNCGACKARLVSGEVFKVKEYEYEFSDTEKNLDYILMCAYTAVTDVSIEAAEASSVDDLPQQIILAKVDNCEAPCDKIRILHVRTPRTKILRFIAGQTAILELGNVQGEYYLASCPCDGSQLEFHIARNPQDPFAEQIFTNIPYCRPIIIRGPGGRFVLEEESSDPALMLAWEHGFAPVNSLIEHAVSIDNIEAFRLYWFSATDDGHYLENLCRSWRDALDHFSYTPVNLAEEDTDALNTYLQTHLASLPDLYHCQVYLAGPVWFIDTIGTFLTRQGVPAERLHRGEVL